MMSKSILLNLYSDPALAARIAWRARMELGRLTTRSFPDGETYLRVDSPCGGRSAVVLVTLRHPDVKLLPLLFLARTLRELGAGTLGIVAPYLPYMRQDRSFERGEGITSRYFAELLSGYFNWLVTVDPHLHRYDSLDDVYSIPARTLHAAPLLSAWIKKKVESPLIIGPDAESKQWVEEVATAAGAPFRVLDKQRHGDREVTVSVPEVERYLGHTPVLVDDIISTGQTMIAAMSYLRRSGMKPPVCLGVHSVFAGTAHADLLEAGAARVVTTNTIVDETSEIDVSDAIVEAMLELNV